MTDQKEDRARDQAATQLESITEMIDRLRHAQKCKNESEDCTEGFGQHEPYEQSKADEYHDEEAARQAIEEDALDVNVRSAFQHVGEDMKAAEFNILLCTGGPAVHIKGELNEHGEPDRAWLEYQDWGTPWTQYFPEQSGSQEYLLEYARCFYFQA